MEARLIALKLFLNALNVPDDISTIDDRKRVQKAVYLGQVAGIDLGYRFGWYLMGPYSTALTRDYYDLAQTGPSIPSDVRLAPHVAQVLTNVAPLLDRPSEVALSLEQWLELLASLHYLRTVRNMNEDDARKVLLAEKNALVAYEAPAYATLRRFKLLGADEVCEAN